MLQVSRSRYYQYLKTSQQGNSASEQTLLLEIKGLDKLSRSSFGSRQMSKHLNAKGYAVGRYKVRKLMKKAGISCKQRRRYKVTTDSNHAHAIAANHLNREFRVSAPNRVWLTDITYLWTAQGWLYIAAVMDLFSRRIVGWAIDTHMRTELVESALEMALCRRHPLSSLMHHSDRGVQYASHHYQMLLKQAGITVSMSRKGNCWDNAVIERFWGSLKSERMNHQIYQTREEAKADIIDYIEMFYNCKRLHSTLNYVTPMQFENNFS